MQQIQAIKLLALGTAALGAGPGVNLRQQDCYVLMPVTGGGQNQVATATALGTLLTPGTVVATITAAAVNGGVAVPVTSLTMPAGTLPAQWAAELVTAINANALISPFYVATQNPANGNIVLTKLDASANDATLNVAIANGSATGVTPEPASAATTAGSATGVNLQIVIEMLNPDEVHWHTVATPAAYLTAGAQPAIQLWPFFGKQIRARVIAYTSGSIAVDGYSATTERD